MQVKINKIFYSIIIGLIIIAFSIYISNNRQANVIYIKECKKLVKNLKPKNEMQRGILFMKCIKERNSYS
jgi:hypothetical protein|tara:strand:+ start:970 stop:1179 length:210 start_codon:yes stop_codon:yes gene_type:complete